jgi:flavorubredoxin
MMVFEETTESLFPADLFIQPGDQPAVITEDLSAAMVAMYRTSGIFAHEAPVRSVVDRVAKIDPAWIHPMHGGSFSRSLAPRFYRALQEQPFAFDGSIMGRSLATAL